MLRLSDAFLGRHAFRSAVNVSKQVLLCRYHQQKVYTRSDLFKLLQLRTFDAKEIETSFHLLQQANPVDENDTKHSEKAITVNATKGLERLYHQEAVEPSAKSLATFRKLLSTEQISTTELNLVDYTTHIQSLGEKLDRRIISIGTSFLLTGVSVGIIIPCMPLLVNELALPPSDMGIVVAAFGLSKLLANMPSAHFVEKYGRKPAIETGLVLCGVGVAAIGLTLLPGFGSNWLIGCRFLSGVGVSAFLAGGFMFVSDISTALNRTRTIAPVMASFHAGSALGPALGGVLVQHAGLAATYGTVGALFLVIAASNHFTMMETKPQFFTPPASTGSTEPSTTAAVAMKSGFKEQFHATTSSWKELAAMPALRDVIAMNGVFWFVWSGAQLTLLPLFLVSNGAYSLSPAELGGFFAVASIVSFLSAQPVAYVADKHSKIGTFMTGLGLASGCIMALPLTGSLTHLFALLVPLSLGSTILNALPASMVTDLTTEAQRAQALSLMRTSGDMGLLLGATTAGIIASQTSIATAFMFDGSVLAAAMVAYGCRLYSSRSKRQ